MSKSTSVAGMVAAAALLSLPVLAQTTTPHTAPPAPPPAATSTHTTTTTTTTRPSDTAHPSMSSNSKYFTADHQVRVSKVVGASVYNDQNQSIGSIDDVLMRDDNHKNDMVVLSVGGFLGMGSKLVSVPFDQLKIENDKVVMPGATKASLEGMPELPLHERVI
jgi:sporulation protein YlmC with PRC-barrel domain